MTSLRTSKTAKVVAGFVGILTVVTMVGGAALPASAQSAADLQAQISSLLATIQSLQAQLAATQGGSSSSAGACSFTRDLTVGVTGDDVKCLQKYLNSKGFTVATTGAGSSGNESTYFGAKTAAAAAKWQAANGVTPAAGYFGAKSRAKYASMGGSTSTTPTPTPMGTGLTVSPATQPTASIAPEGASRVPFTRFTLTASNDGDVTVNGITVERQGLANDAVFAGIALLDQNGIQIGVSKTLNSNHQATVGAPFTIPRGTSMTLTIAGNMQTGSTALDAYAGQVAAIAVVGIQTSATVNGSLPIVGAGQTINATLTIGSATLIVSSYDPNSLKTQSIGDTNVKFSGVRITAGSSEAVRLWSIRFNQSGSAGATDLANVKVYIDGTAYPTVVSSDGKYFTATFGSGIVIDKGLSKDAYIQGDLVGSSITNRTVQFDIYKNTDIYLTGETYGYGITPTATGNCATTATNASEFIYSGGSGCTGTVGTPFFSASLFNINPGSATSISKATSVVAQNIAVNVPNQILGGFTTNFVGEPVSVQSMTFAFATSAVAWGGPITSITIVDENGAVVAGPMDEASTCTNNCTVTFTDTVTFATGSHTYTIKGKIPANTANNATVTVSTTPSSQWSNIQGQISGNSITLSNGLVTMNQMTVKAAALAMSLSTTPASSNIVAGGQQILFANVQLDASQSGEDMRVTQVKLRQGGAGTNSYLSSCQVYNGTTALNTGSNVPTSIVATANTFNFDNPVVIAKGTVVTIGLKCNVAAGADGPYRFDLNASDTVTATGVTSGSSLTVTPTAASGGTMTVNTATLAVSLDSSSPAYSVAANGSTGVTTGVLRFTTTNEAMNLTKVALQLSPTGSSASSTPADVVQVSLWDGATQVGTATFTGSSRNATSTLSSPVMIPKDSYKLLTMKVDLPTLNAQAGLGNNPKPGALVKVDYDGNDSTGTQASGIDSGTTISPVASASDTSSAGVRVFKSYPIFTYSTTGGNGALQNGTNDVLVLNVQANSSGDIQLRQLIFSIATTTVSFTAPTFSGPNGNVNSTAITLTSSLLTVLFDSTTNTSDKTIAAGQTKTYTLRGTISGLTGSVSGSIGVALKADTAYPAISPDGLSNALLGNTATTGVANSNIIWSPNSTTTVTTNNNDWTNAYGLPGCYSSTGLGQDCTQRVTSK